MSTQGFVEEHADGIQVAPSGCGRAEETFRRQVSGRGEQLDGLRLIHVVDGFGDAEVAHLGVTVVGHQHVAGLDVAVDDARGVRGGQGGEDLNDDGARPIDGQRTGRDFVRERSAGKSFHHEKRDPVLLAAVEDRDDVGVREAGGRACLRLEPGARSRLLGEVGAQDLHRDPAPETLIRRVAHRRHTALPEQAVQLVAPGEHRCSRGNVVVHPRKYPRRSGVRSLPPLGSPGVIA